MSQGSGFAEFAAACRIRFFLNLAQVASRTGLHQRRQTRFWATGICIQTTADTTGRKIHSRVAQTHQCNGFSPRITMNPPVGVGENIDFTFEVL